MLVTNYKFIVSFLFLLMVGALPSLLTINSENKSFSKGAMVYSIICILLCLRQLKKTLRVKKRIAYGAVLIFFYFLMQHIFVGTWGSKSYFSIMALAIYILAAYLASFELAKFDSKIILKSCHCVFYLMVFLGFLHIITSFSIGKSLGYKHGQPMFPFLEPSHYALYLGAFLLIYSTTKSSWSRRLIALAAVTSISLLIPSTTLLTFVVIAGLVLISTLRAKAAFFAFPAIIIFALFGMNKIMSNEYFSGRLALSSESSNMTALVYLQGLQDAQNSLKQTNGFGLGLQMLGTQPPSIYSSMIAKITGNVNNEQNRDDGGFLAAKVVAELGYLGIYLIFAYILYCFKCVRSIRRILLNNQLRENSLTVISYCITIAFSVELFVRSAGYFSPQVFIFLISTFYILHHQKSLTKRQLISRKFEGGQG